MELKETVRPGSIKFAHSFLDGVQNFIAAQKRLHCLDIRGNNTVVFKMGYLFPNCFIGFKRPLTRFEVGKQVHGLGRTHQFDGDDALGISDNFPALP